MKKNRLMAGAALCLALALLPAGLRAQTTLSPVKDRYYYTCGTPVKMELTVRNPATKELKTSGTQKVVIMKDSQEVLQELTFDLSKGNPVTFETTLNEPGILWFQMNRKIVNGVSFEPEKLRQGYPEPADFDAFWKNLLEKQAGVKDPVRLFPLPENTLPGFDCFKVAVRVFSGRDIYGFLNIPKGRKGPFNVYVQVIPAGPGYTSPEPTFNRQDTITLGMNVHSFDPADVKTAYDKNYMYAGIEDRDTWYFRDAILAACTAVNWLAAREDFSGNMVYLSSSQGGGMGLATAALTNRYKALAITVPALCDLGGSLAGHGAGWPDPIRKLAGDDKAKAERILKATSYYDAVNFARRVKCPVLFSVGLIDIICAPSSVYVAYNNVTSPKSIIPCPNFGHGVPWEILNGHWQWAQGYLPDDQFRSYVKFYRW